MIEMKSKILLDKFIIILVCSVLSLVFIMPVDQISYSEKYYDEKYEFR